MEHLFIYTLYTCYQRLTNALCLLYKSTGKISSLIDEEGLYSMKQRLSLYVSWARLVSDVVSPPAVWAVLVIPVALKFSPDPRKGIFLAALYGIFVSLIPVLFIMTMVSFGKIGDIHMKERRERYIPFMVTIACTITVIILFRFFNAPPAFGLLALISLVQITLTTVITFVWQISIHMMSIAAAAVAVGVIFGLSSALAIVPLVMLVGAARLRLKRHTPAQVIAGTILGSTAPMLFLLYMPNSILRAL